ncbi:GNAT family N-acetyltransferase [Streptococcus sp. ZJ93]|uniref:GNAT family N-acetyltransferase n=1 Tax=Streptococcus handemini TaxID=3161188 RepID=UPI0034D695E6
MAVRKNEHRRGVGCRLLAVLEEQAKETVSFLQVKAVAKGWYETYDQTNEFYQAMGFYLLEIFLTLWKEAISCAIWVKYLK